MLTDYIQVLDMVNRNELRHIPTLDGFLQHLIWAIHCLYVETNMIENGGRRSLSTGLLKISDQNLLKGLWLCMTILSIPTLTCLLYTYYWIQIPKSLIQTIFPSFLPIPKYATILPLSWEPYTSPFPYHTETPSASILHHNIPLSSSLTYISKYSSFSQHFVLA